MSIESMGNLNNSGIKGPEKSSKDDELIIEKTRNPFEKNIPQTLEEKKRHRLEDTASTGLFGLDDPEFKDKETFEERAKKATQEASPVVREMAVKKAEEIKKIDFGVVAQLQKNYEKMNGEKAEGIERLKGDQGHLLVLEKKIELAKKIIAENKDQKEVDEARRELELTQQEYDKYFDEYSKAIQESMNKK
jgi:hypothetical protein